MTTFLSTLARFGVLLEVHWLSLLLAAAVICAVVLLIRTLVTRFGPGDLTGTGIAIGAPKMFDNRSLELMLEQLNSSLQTFNVVGQNLSRNLGAFQQQDTFQAASRLQLGVHAGREAAGDERQQADMANAAAKSSSPGFSPSIGMGAADALTDQLNLTYQIFNLRILNERSFSDRLIVDKVRKQVVLGFQVSIDPPAGAEDCAAIAEISLELPGAKKPVSIVALIPQEKTYNAASFSSRANSIDGSVVSKVLTLGGAASRRNDHLYLHRDADTIAFERDPRQESGAFGLRPPKTKQAGTVFGWEFRPVLGRRAVSPGTRQMLAVIALPCPDEVSAELVVRTRAYWRRYDRVRQTTKVRWIRWPFERRLGSTQESAGQTITIEPSAELENKLSPIVEKIAWVDAGSGVAVILVEGQNFFSGTAVTMGGKTHRDPASGLTLKSDHAFEVRTTVEALAHGDAVLSGRFGPSKALTVNPEKLPAAGISVDRATFGIIPDQDYLYLSIVIVSAEIDKGKYVRVDDLRRLPVPILYLNDVPLPGPYDYEDDFSSPASALGEPGTRVNDAVCVKAWAPAASLLGTNAVVVFKVPFCGIDWVAQTVLQSAEAPRVTRIGSDSANTTLIISRHSDFKGPWIAQLDRDYTLGTAGFDKIDERHLRLTVPLEVAGNYSKLHLRVSAENGYVLDIPSSDKPPVEAVIDDSEPPALLVQGVCAICEWKGSGLDRVSSVKIDGSDAQFSTYSAGTKISVFAAAGQTSRAGKHEVEFIAASGPRLKAAFFVAGPAPGP